jgi:hypothetical protein
MCVVVDFAYMESRLYKWGGGEGVCMYDVLGRVLCVM